MRRAFVLGFLALSFASASHAALAQKKRGARAEPAATAQAASGQSDDVARGLFQAGKAAFEAGNYVDALSFFEQAHARSGRPELLFNVGQAADRLRQDEKTLEAFRAYLAQLPEAANRVEVEARIAAIERSVAERKSALAASPTAPVITAPTPAQTAEQAPTAATQDDPAFTGSDSAGGRPVTKQWWFWTGIGAVVVGGAAVALAVALGGEEAEREPFYEGNGGSLQAP